MYVCSSLVRFSLFGLWNVEVQLYTRRDLGIQIIFVLHDQVLVAWKKLCNYMSSELTQTNFGFLSSMYVGMLCNYRLITVYLLLRWI